MHVEQLSLLNFRNYDKLDVQLSPGLTVISGNNGNGKTNIVEAIAYCSTLKSFRHANNAAMVQDGYDEAIMRCRVRTEQRERTIEIALTQKSRQRIQLNGQRVQKTDDIRDALFTTVFSPDDLEYIKGGPQFRRTFLDTLLEQLHPKNAVAILDFEKTLRQRNAFLKSIYGQLSRDEEFTLDIWNEQFAVAGERLAMLRWKLCEQLEPLVREAYEQIASEHVDVAMTYAPSFTLGTLATELKATQANDIRRRVSTVGPQRDDVEMFINGLSSRTHRSQGEQRSLMLSLRMASHRLSTNANGMAPVLLLDDVLSELDPQRVAALLQHLPAAQTIITTASDVASDVPVDHRIEIELGRVTHG